MILNINAMQVDATLYNDGRFVPRRTRNWHAWGKDLEDVWGAVHFGYGEYYVISLGQQLAEPMRHAYGKAEVTTFCVSARQIKGCSAPITGGVDCTQPPRAAFFVSEPWSAMWTSPTKGDAMLDPLRDGFSVQLAGNKVWVRFRVRGEDQALRYRIVAREFKYTSDPYAP